MPAAGYKLFVTGDVLTAAQVNDYLMLQTVMVFANSAARTSALSGVLAEGLVSYLKDTDVVEIYTGAAWVSLDDPNAIQNSIVDAKGDLITATADNTPARLAVGSDGMTIVADSTAATGLAWATAASSGMTKIVTANFSASATVQINNCFTSTYVNYVIVLNALGNSAGGALFMQWQTGTSTIISSADYYGGGWSVTNAAATATITSNGATKFTLAPTVATNLRQNFTINCSNVGNSSQDANMSSLGNGSGNGIATFAGIINAAATYTGVAFTGNGNLTGTYTVYGLAK